MAFDDNITYSGPVEAGDDITFNLLNAMLPQVGTLAARPSAGNENVVYIATDTGQAFYDTGTSWASFSMFGPLIGEIRDYAGNTIPQGYLECDGSAVSRTTYAGLFAVIGTRWGNGNGATTFNIPDLRRRTTIGAGGTRSQGPGTAVGNTGGSEQATAPLPSHAHTQGTHAHTQGNHFHSQIQDPANDDRGLISNLSGSAIDGITFSGTSRQSGSVGNIFKTNAASAGTINSSSAGTIASAGSGTGVHPNMQPSAVVRKIIKI